MRAFKLSVLLAVGSFLFVTSGASAQTQQPVDVYHFDDDDLMGDTWGVTAPLLRVRSEKLPRVMLLRPRASFVGEMLKSVEVL